MRSRARIPIAVLVWCALALPTAVAQGADTASISAAAFSPDRLGVPANVLGNVKLRSAGQRTPSPITHVNLYGPPGSTLNLEGTRTCRPAELENVGPEACPAASKVGSGGGEGVYELGKELVKEKFTLEVFLANNTPGQTALLIYLNGTSPFGVQQVFTASAVAPPKPYGIGFAIEVPLLRVLPEASYASASSAFLSLGAREVPYYKTVRGKRKLFHTKGIVTPGSCPRGGWLVAAQFGFQDGSTALAKSRIACPKR